MLYIFTPWSNLISQYARCAVVGVDILGNSFAYSLCRLPCVHRTIWPSLFPCFVKHTIHFTLEKRHRRVVNMFSGGSHGPYLQVFMPLGNLPLDCVRDLWLASNQWNTATTQDNVTLLQKVLAPVLLAYISFLAGLREPTWQGTASRNCGQLWKAEVSLWQTVRKKLRSF